MFKASCDAWTQQSHPEGQPRPPCLPSACSLTLCPAHQVSQVPRRAPGLLPMGWSWGPVARPVPEEQPPERIMSVSWHVISSVGPCEMGPSDCFCRHGFHRKIVAWGPATRGGVLLSSTPSPSSQASPAFQTQAWGEKPPFPSVLPDQTNRIASGLTSRSSWFPTCLLCFVPMVFVSPASSQRPF